MYLINSICIDVLFVFKIIFSGLIKNKDHTIDFYFSFLNIDIQKYKNNLKLKYFFSNTVFPNSTMYYMLVKDTIVI